MIVVVTNSTELEERLRAVGEGEPPPPVRRIAAVAAADIEDPALEVVVIDGRDDQARALALAERFDDRRPDVTIVLHADVAPDDIARAMHSGIRDIIPTDADDDRLREALKRALEVADRRHSHLAAGDLPSNRLIVTMSPKGGAGKTTVSSNLAIGLATRHPNQVVIVDADLQFGDVGNAMRLVGDSDVRHAVGGNLQDVTEVKVHLTAHRAGLFALLAPDLPGVADEIDPQSLARAVRLLADEFRYVVVDTDPGLGERTLALVDHATDLVLVAATDVASVRGLHKTIQALDQLGLTNQRRHFVLNRADAKVGLEIADIAVTVGMEPDVRLPSHRTVPLSLNLGVPLLEESDRSPVVEPLWALVDLFAPTPHGGHDVEDDSRRSGRRWRWS